MSEEKEQCLHRWKEKAPSPCLISLSLCSLRHRCSSSTWSHDFAKESSANWEKQRSIYIVFQLQLCAPCWLILPNLKITSGTLHSKTSRWTRCPTIPSSGIGEGAFFFFFFFFLPVTASVDTFKHWSDSRETQTCSALNLTKNACWERNRTDEEDFPTSAAGLWGSQMKLLNQWHERFLNRRWNTELPFWKVFSPQ